MSIFHGVDASAYQGVIDWRRVKSVHIDFAILRATVGNGKFESNTDRLFHRNMYEATEAGLFTGAYHSSLATNADEAHREAEGFLYAIRDYKLAYPVAIDVEDRTLRYLPADKLDTVVRTWCRDLQKAGYYPMIRAGLYTITNRLSPQTVQEFDLWLLKHGDLPDYNGNVGIWQYTVYGSVGGVRTKIGRDKALKDYPAIMRERGLGGYSPPVQTPKVAEPEKLNSPLSASTTSSLLQAVELLSGLIAVVDILKTLSENESLTSELLESDLKDNSNLQTQLDQAVVPEQNNTAETDQFPTTENLDLNAASHNLFDTETSDNDDTDNNIENTDENVIVSETNQISEPPPNQVDQRIDEIADQAKIEDIENTQATDSSFAAILDKVIEEGDPVLPSVNRLPEDLQSRPTLELVIKDELDDNDFQYEIEKKQEERMLQGKWSRFLNKNQNKK